MSTGQKGAKFSPRSHWMTPLWNYGIVPMLKSSYELPRNSQKLQISTLLKVVSEEIIPLPCKCSILLSPTFVEIKNSFTKTLLDSNSKNFRIFFYWKKTDESEPF